MDDAWNLDVHVNFEDSLFWSFMNFLLMDRNTLGLNPSTKHLKTYYSICFNKYPLGYSRTPRKWSKIYNKTLSFHFYKFYFRIANVSMIKQIISYPKISKNCFIYLGPFSNDIFQTIFNLFVLRVRVHGCECVFIGICVVLLIIIFVRIP